MAFFGTNCQHPNIHELRSDLTACGAMGSGGGGGVSWGTVSGEGQWAGGGVLG
jgi:hypothetical protein